jgi:hypothetical protein
MLTTTTCPHCGGWIDKRGWNDDSDCLNCGRTPGYVPRPAVKVRAEPYLTRKQNHRPRGGGRRTDLTASTEIAERLASRG